MALVLLGFVSVLEAEPPEYAVVVDAGYVSSPCGNVAVPPPAPRENSATTASASGAGHLGHHPASESAPVTALPPDTRQRDLDELRRILAALDSLSR